MSQYEEKVREVLNSMVKKKFPPNTKVKVKPASSFGANYTSSLFEATIITPEKNIELFIKIASMGDIYKDNSDHVFKTEKFVYSTLIKAYEDLQDKHGLTNERLIFPRCYSNDFTENNSILIMENLVSKGYTCLDKFKLDWKNASKCVETMANYHALSLALCKQCPEEFKKAGEALTLPRLTGSEWNGVADAALAVVDGEDREILSRIVEGCVGFSIMFDISRPRKTSAIVHGDYRPGNLMYKEVNGKPHLIAVDYQLMRVGCPVADLIYFLTMATDQQFRQQHFHPLVDHYYEQLARAMRRLDLVPEEVYGREEFDSDMKEKLPIGLGFAAISLPFVTADTAQATNTPKEQFMPPANELFAERFRELVQDFKQWGFI